ncbi:hypothetical protein, partial [Klebsiella michiganensis]|uniref:hypothetical protein n=1 Tax=Klebsiella michiganensis TaxID=1134687 RepID=UPI002540C8DC
MVHKTEPVRELEIKYDDNGHPSWCSFPSHKNVQVRGACDVPLDLTLYIQTPFLSYGCDNFLRIYSR